MLRRENPKGEEEDSGENQRERTGRKGRERPGSGAGETGTHASGRGGRRGGTDPGRGHLGTWLAEGSGGPAPAPRAPSPGLSAGGGSGALLQVRWRHRVCGGRSVAGQAAGRVAWRGRHGGAGAWGAALPSHAGRCPPPGLGDCAGHLQLHQAAAFEHHLYFTAQ